MPADRSPSSVTPEGAEERVALVLDAGGARSAYQVGALEVLVPALAAQGRRPSVVVGTSAGALIGAAVTATAHLDPDEQVSALGRLLDSSTKRDVIQPLWRQVPEVAVRYASETLGLSVFRLRGLFGTRPLARTLGREIEWDALHANVASGLVAATAVLATTVRTGQVTIFTECAGDGALPGESPHHRRYVATRLAVEHLMASSAIPALFPSVRVREPAEAAGWYVDGATRRRFPLAPAVELGADRVVVVGTGSLLPGPPEDGDDDQSEEDARPGRGDDDRAAVDLADGGATLLGAVMDDPLRHDLRRLAEVNEQMEDPDMAPHLVRHRERQGREPQRVVPYAAVLPRRGSELSRLAMDVFRTNHAGLRRTLRDPDLQVVHRILGSDSPLQGQLLSYLMFDRDFSREAAALGRRDAERWLTDHPDLWVTGHLRPEPSVG